MQTVICSRVRIGGHVNETKVGCFVLTMLGVIAALVSLLLLVSRGAFDALSWLVACAVAFMVLGSWALVKNGR